MITQRFAALSYSTVPSPSLLMSQGGPKPVQSVLPGTGPYSGMPVVLSKTAIDAFTHSTIRVAPTALFGSGGAWVMLKAPCGPTKPPPNHQSWPPTVTTTEGLGDF
jgi:hypothetical protein